MRIPPPAHTHPVANNEDFSRQFLGFTLALPHPITFVEEQRRKYHLLAHDDQDPIKKFQY